MITSNNLSSIFVLDQDEALHFYVGVLGLEVRADLPLGPMRWLTVGVPGEPAHEVLLELPAPPSMDEGTGARVRELVAKGAGGGWLGFATDDARAAHADLVGKGVDITDGPNEQPYGVDFGLRDPFGNRLRIVQRHPAPAPAPTPAPTAGPTPGP